MNRELFKKDSLLRTASTMTDIGIRFLSEECDKKSPDVNNVENSIKTLRMGIIFAFFAKLEYAIENGQTLLEFLEEQMKYNLIGVQVFEQMQLLANKNTPEPEAKEFITKFSEHLTEKYFKK